MIKVTTNDKMCPTIYFGTNDPEVVLSVLAQIGIKPHTVPFIYVDILSEKETVQKPWRVNLYKCHDFYDRVDFATVKEAQESIISWCSIRSTHTASYERI